MAMRLATFRDGAGIRLGVERAGRLVDLTPAATLTGMDLPTSATTDMLALMSGGSKTLARISELIEIAPQGTLLAVDEVEFLAPIPRPRKNIFCVGRNYAEHAAESMRAVGREVQLPPAPNIFTKAVTAVTGPNADIPYDPGVSTQLDWEVELGVVMGRGGRHITREEALTRVFGYTIINDISARDIQNRPGMQWFLGKSLDGSCPMGPVIVTADEILDPQALTLRLAVNGSVKQEDTTAQMLFDVAAIIAELSRYLTLEPGDIIATGTPAGVGFARTPPEFLQPGDVMETTVEGIGTLRNRIVALESA
jgi:2-keto-4-pentenoate hydratase/2-oxohepta-3-ene-1,7-dioic acid hydratase in catechol pathway